MILGDDYKLMGETAKVAKQKLGCQVFRRPSYFRKAGHLQAGLTGLISFPHRSISFCPGCHYWLCRPRIYGGVCKRVWECLTR